MRGNGEPIIIEGKNSPKDTEHGSLQGIDNAPKILSMEVYEALTIRAVTRK